MDAGLNKAFCGVYNSSKEIIKNNQRHLFCNMLDLLARTTKTTGDKYLNMDEFILFWTTDILPLVFDEDKDIQKSAIAAMETVAQSFNFKALHSLPGWSDIKTKIVQNYSKEIPKYREISNSCWYKIWCLLIRILDKEIVKGASTINAFLSVVELGFRSPDYNVRIEAFYCWKVLIEIFAKNEELCSPKRIRLIYIPLKSSQSKTPQAAVVKFRVWWYLICKLGSQIEQYVDTILETFLAFCYGSLQKGGCGSVEFKEMTILSLISMLGSSNPKLVSKRMENFEIDIMSEHIINKNIMNKFWKSIINYSIEGLKDCKVVQGSGSDLSEVLMRNILINVISTEYTEALSFLLTKLYTLDDKSAARNMQNIVQNSQFSSCISAVENGNFLGTALAAICKILISDDTQTPAVEEVIKIIFVLNSDRFRHVLDVFLTEILANSKTRSLKGVIATWKLISKSLLKHFGRSHQSECDVNLNIINLWITWPLKTYAEVQNTTTEKIFDDQFEALLHMTVERLNNAINKIAFLKETSMLLQKMYNQNAMHSDLNSYFACFIRILVSASSNIEYNEELISVIFNILKINLAGDFHKGNFELCMKCLKAMVSYLGEKGLQKYFADIKDVWSHVINKKRSNYIEKGVFDDYRKQFLDDSRRVASKTLYNKIKNYLDNDDLFVIIPAVWSLNPDKLTERQKEKFYEKSDIPALYNDMSQSQDAFIKPWTPKKLVIAKGTADEIVIGDGGHDLKPVSPATPTAPAPAPILTPSPVANSNDNNRKDKINSPKKVIQPKQEEFSTILHKIEPVSDVTETPDKNVFPTKNSDDDNTVSNCRLTRAKLSSIEAEDIENNGHLEDYVEQVEAIILKDTSSPPDRKQTNNSTSPVLKPKTTHLTGRGAQLINMIRNKKHDNYSSKQMETSTPVTKMEANRERTDSYLNWSSGENDSKASPMNLLVFSKTLPSPCASPSASILKRKYHNDSIEEIYDSQAFKRKRVSFHDPPVSVTKEYLKDDENKNNSKRCLLLDQEQKGTTKHMLRRSAKIENQIQTSDNITDISGLNGTPPVKKIKCNLMKTEDNSKKNGAELNQSTSTGEKASSFPFLFRTETDVLNFVLKQFTIEDIFEKYLSDEKADKAGINFSRFISNYMNVSPKFKSTILETLSEKHPKEFLDYAIQENLSSVVCDRLNSNTIIDYVCSKSQTNIACRQRLFQEMQEILNHDKFSDEKCEFIQKVVTSKSMSDQQLLNLIEMLFESKRKHQRAVSESAIDSSSTL